MLRCYKCRKRVKYTSQLIVIGRKSYCKRCLSNINIRIKNTGEFGSYYTNVNSRVFLSFRDVEGLEIREYDPGEIAIGVNA